MSTKGIGRLFALGLAKETTRGTAISSAAYWLPFNDLGFDEKFENAMKDQAFGVIENSVGESRVKNWAEGTFKVPLIERSIGLLLYTVMGGYAVSGPTDSSYTHTFTVGQSAQHQSLTMFIHDTLSGQDYSHANGVIHKLDIDAEVKKFVELTLSAKAQKGAAQSAFTPSLLTENYFLPQYMTFSSAPSTAGVNGTLTATGTAATTVNVTGLSINTNLLNVGMRVTAANLPAGATITAIVSSSAFTLSVATTGAIGTMTFNGAIVALKSFKLSIDENIEDQDVLGSVSPSDFLNKEFKVEGTLEAIFQNNSDFKTVSLATPTVGQGLLIDIKNTDVTIGAATNPELKITLDQVYFSEYSRPVKVKDLVYQTVKFRATYNTTNSEMIKLALTNTVTTY
jgi:hypothetical protein